MSEDNLRKAIDDWEKEAEKLVQETRKVGASTSKELDKQVKKLQDDGAKLMETIRKGDPDSKLKMDIERRYNVARDKLARAWKELQK